jgi:cellulose synthase/poly-beta-1,6-N-acetylglucosamine synthase-like glycosyltransferase
MDRLLFIYLCVGPLAWVLLAVGTVMGRSRMSGLLCWTWKLPENPPSVTVLIPAKDEGPGISGCLDAVLAQTYLNFNVIAIDDRSVDDTGGILDARAGRDSRMRAMHIPKNGLPDGWLGKCHALHVGAKEARGEWLWFVDSDVTVSPDALARTLSVASARNYDAVSLLTSLECHLFLERLMLPPLAAAWAIMHTVSLTNEDSRTTIAAANGQFFLIRRQAYEAVGGHEAVKDQITEDVELMRLLKSREYKVRLFSGAPLAKTRMHSNLKQMFNGWARIYSGTARRSPWRILGAAWFILTAIFSLYAALVHGIYRSIDQSDHVWLTASAVHLALMSGYLAMVYHWSGNRARYSLLIPLSGGLMLAILAFSLRKCQTGRITWRDTEFAVKSR